MLEHALSTTGADVILSGQRSNPASIEHGRPAACQACIYAVPEPANLRLPLAVIEQIIDEIEQLAQGILPHKYRTDFTPFARERRKFG